MKHPRLYLALGLAAYVLMWYGQALAATTPPAMPFWTPWYDYLRWLITGVE